MIHRACSILYSKRSIIVLFSSHRQGYLTEFNQLYEELQGKGVEVYAITAQTQDLVDQLRRDLNLQFKVLLHLVGNYIEWSSLSWVCLILTPWGARFSYTTFWLPATVASIRFRCLFSLIYWKWWHFSFHFPRPSVSRTPPTSWGTIWQNRISSTYESPVLRPLPKESFTKSTQTTETILTDMPSLVRIIMVLELHSLP